MRSHGAPFILCLLVALPLGTVHPLNSDEGTILAGAWNMLGGKRLYLDFFEFDAPGAYVVTYASFVVLGAAYWSARLAAIVLLAASGVAVGDVAARLGATRPAATGAAIGWVAISSLPGIMVNHNAESAFVGAIALALVIATLDAPGDRRRWMVAGLALGLLPLFHQAKGVALAASVGPALAVCAPPGRRHLPVLLVAMAVPLALASATWGPALLFQRLVLWPADHYVSVNRVPFGNFITACAVATGLGVAAWTTTERRVLLGVVLVAQGALLASALTRPDLDHLLFVAFPMPALAAVAVGRLPEPARRRWTVASLGLLAIMVCACVSRNMAAHSARRAIVSALRASGVARFHAEPFLAQLYFELRADNPYPHSFLLTGMHTDEQFAENLAVLMDRPPPFVLRNRTVVEKFRYDWSNPLDRWIDAHYAPRGHAGSVEILAWRGDAVP